MKKYVIWVVRRSSTGKLKRSDPCNACCNALKTLGFRKIAYSNNKGEMEMVDLRYYTNNHISNSQEMTATYSMGI